MLSDDAVGKTEMIMGERVAGIVVDDDAMAADRLGVVFHAQKVVCQRIANLLVIRAVPGAGARADRQLENQRDQNQKTNARPPTQLLLVSPSLRPAGKESDGSRNFCDKKTRRSSATLR